MSSFEADLEAFKVWWLSAGDKPRATETAYEYCRHLRKFFDWQQRTHSEVQLIATMRDARGYLAEVREHSRWQAFMAARALKQWSRFCADDGLADTDTLATPQVREGATHLTYARGRAGGD